MIEWYDCITRQIVDEDAVADAIRDAVLDGAELVDHSKSRGFTCVAPWPPARQTADFHIYAGTSVMYVGRIVP